MAQLLLEAWIFHYSNFDGTIPHFCTAVHDFNQHHRERSVCADAIQYIIRFIVLEVFQWALHILPEWWTSFNERCAIGACGEHDESCNVRETKDNFVRKPTHSLSRTVKERLGS